MKDFCYYAPTEVVFGEHSEEQTSELVRRDGGCQRLYLTRGHGPQRH